MKVKYTCRALLSLEALDPAGETQARALISRAANSLDASEILRMPDAQALWALRENRTDCPRSLAVLYRADGADLSVVDVLELPPIPRRNVP